MAEQVAGIVGWLAGGGPLEGTWDSPTDRNIRGCTLLMLASLRGHEALVEALTERKAKLDARDGHGATALMIASAHNRHTVVAQLLRAGARTDVPTNKGRTALQLSEERGYGLVAQLIRTHDAAMAGQPAELPDAVATAARAGALEEVLEWVACGGHIDATNPGAGGMTLLMLACAQGHETLVNALLERGASTDLKRADDGATALMIAAYAAHRGVVRQLVVYKRPPQPNYETITTPIDVPEYALEFRASGRWRAPPALASAPGIAAPASSLPKL